MKTEFIPKVNIRILPKPRGLHIEKKLKNTLRTIVILKTCLETEAGMGLKPLPRKLILLSIWQKKKEALNMLFLI